MIDVVPPPPCTFDLAGRATLTVVGDEGDAHYVGSQMDPFRAGPVAPGVPEVRLERVTEIGSARLVDRHGPAGDGVVTGSDGERAFLLRDGAACTVPDALNDEPVRFELAPGFPLAGIFGPAVRPALQLAMVSGGSVALHAAAVEMDGEGIAIAGWSESGKTETALAYMEQGARFVSDKWTVVGSDQSISAFPIGVGLRRWVLAHLPRLRASLGPATRGRLTLARAAGAAHSVLTAAPTGGGGAVEVARDLAVRGASLAERVPLTPRELRSAYGQQDEPALRAPLRAVALLTTVPGPDARAEPADPEWAVERLVRSAAFERSAYFALQDRARFALPRRARGMREEVMEAERRALARALEGTRVIDVRAPFPTDPRPVAEAISRCLR